MLRSSDSRGRKPTFNLATPPVELGLIPRRDEIERFLSVVSKGAIQLLAIDERRSPVAKWFGDDASGAAAWAAKINSRGYNLYWTVNEVQAGLNSKPKKSDIEKVRYVHVDIDPRPGVEFNKLWQIIDLELLPLNPTFVVDSGGGVQAFWRLRPGVLASDAEDLSKSVTKLLRGDACWNIDRLMRVAGTVNHPNAKKRAEGRVPVLAELVADCRNKQYAIEDLRSWAESRLDPSEAPTGCAEGKSLPPMSDRLRRLIMDPPGIDRSKDTFSAACEMARCGYDGEQMMSVLLDPELPISAHCLDQADAERAARRAINRAREMVKPVGAAEDGSNQHEISAEPFSWPSASQIPRRPWLYGTQLQRGLLSLLVAPGGTGKTSYTVGLALTLASGEGLLGASPRKASRVWLYNLEDPLDELNRAIIAACTRHQIAREQIANRLFVNSGIDHKPLCTAVQNRDGFQLNEPIVDSLVEELQEKSIDVLIVDPFVSTHQVNENDNGAIDAVAKAWARVASLANCAILLVHHTPKNLQAVTSDAARGASSLVNAARSVITLNRMNAEEAKRYGIEPTHARRYVKAYDDKNNRAPPADASNWFELVSERLPNGSQDCDGDSVGVVVPWVPPTVQAERDLDLETITSVAHTLATPKRESAQSPDWAGYAIAQALNLKSETPAEKQQLRAIIRGTLFAGAIEIIEAPDDRRKTVKWLRMSPDWIEENSQALHQAPPSSGAQSRSGAMPKCSTAPGAPPPLRGGDAGAEQGKREYG